MAEARAGAGTVVNLYRNRADVRWSKAEFAGRMADLADPDALLDVTERELLIPLDRAAEQEVISAARQVPTVTAVVPMAGADVVVATGAVAVGDDLISSVLGAVSCPRSRAALAKAWSMAR